MLKVVLKKFSTASLVALTLVFSSVGSAFSADLVVPSQKIEGNLSVESGKEVKLNLSPIGTKPPNYSSNSVSWKVFIVNKDGLLTNKDFKNDGKFVTFNSTENKYKVFASVSYLYLYTDRLGRINQVLVYNKLFDVDITVKSLETFPQFITRTVNETVKTETKALAASKLADSFGGMSAKIAAGTELDVDKTKQALADTKEANRQALASVNVPVAEWDEFFNKLQDYLYQLKLDGKLKTKQDYVDVFKGISSGLKEVK